MKPTVVIKRPQLMKWTLIYSEVFANVEQGGGQKCRSIARS